MPEATSFPAAIAGLRIEEIARLVAERRLPPVDRWDPPFCGASGMVIAADGTWSHDGAPIARPAMVRLFAGLLRHEADGGYVLVTPVEKLSIQVVDLPFVAVEVLVEGSAAARSLAFRLGTGELVIADRDHPLHFGPELPRLLVRAGLEARLSRSVFYELVNLALDDGAEPLGLWSQGTFFELSAE